MLDVAGDPPFKNCLAHTKKARYLAQERTSHFSTWIWVPAPLWIAAFCGSELWEQQVMAEVSGSLPSIRDLWGYFRSDRYSSRWKLSLSHQTMAEKRISGRSVSGNIQYTYSQCMEIKELAWCWELSCHLQQYPWYRAPVWLLATLLSIHHSALESGKVVESGSSTRA